MFQRRVYSQYRFVYTRIEAFTLMQETAGHWLKVWGDRGVEDGVFNPFAASACKDARTRLQTVFFPRSYSTSTFNAMHFDKILSPASAKQKTKRLEGVRFWTLIGCFQVTSWQ